MDTMWRNWLLVFMSSFASSVMRYNEFLNPLKTASLWFCLSEKTMWAEATRRPGRVNQISALQTVGSRYRLQGPGLIYK